MIEVEAKARSRPDTIQKILDLGANLVGVEHHCDAYFNSPRRDFKESDEALRIRVKDQGARLTYKGPKLDLQTKSRLELTVEIDDPVTMENILTALGFVKSGTVKKVRTKYALGQAVLALDEVEGLGSFIEVEILGSDFGSDRDTDPSSNFNPDSSPGLGSDEVEADFAEKRDQVME
ncbi:MAG TPA: class IV adenylate cyclase, partial [Methanotrichaceae archaeon]|nr:class IV adenylate cyclase [Methanotrichaceae archaeon]